MFLRGEIVGGSAEPGGAKWRSGRATRWPEAAGEGSEPTGERGDPPRSPVLRTERGTRRARLGPPTSLCGRAPRRSGAKDVPRLAHARVGGSNARRTAVGSRCRVSTLSWLFARPMAKPAPLDNAAARRRTCFSQARRGGATACCVDEEVVDAMRTPRKRGPARARQLSSRSAVEGAEREDNAVVTMRSRPGETRAPLSQSAPRAPPRGRVVCAPAKFLTKPAWRAE